MHKYALHNFENLIKLESHSLIMSVKYRRSSSEATFYDTEVDPDPTERSGSPPPKEEEVAKTTAKSSTKRKSRRDSHKKKRSSQKGRYLTTIIDAFVSFGKNLYHQEFHKHRQRCVKTFTKNTTCEMMKSEISLTR